MSTIRLDLIFPLNPAVDVVSHLFLHFKPQTFPYPMFYPSLTLSHAQELKGTPTNDVQWSVYAAVYLQVVASRWHCCITRTFGSL